MSCFKQARRGKARQGCLLVPAPPASLVTQCDAGLVAETQEAGPERETEPCSSQAGSCEASGSAPLDHLAKACLAGWNSCTGPFAKGATELQTRLWKVTLD